MLKRKMFRDVKNNASQFITIFLMILIGLMAYTGIEAYMLGMKYSADNYYEENNLQDLDVYGEFTDNEIDQIKDIDGVADAEGVLTFLADVDNKDDHQLELNFINSNNISKFYVEDGIEFNNEDGIWIDNYYAKENNLNVGDTIELTYNSLTLKEEIKGLIETPDHVYSIKDSTELFPNHSNYGYAYLSINEITEDYIKTEVSKELNIDVDKIDYVIKDFDYKDYIKYSNIIVDIDNKDDFNDIKKDIIEIDNVYAVTKIEDSFSYSGYQSEIEEGETYIGPFTYLFIFIALISVITTMTRIVKQERTQIGTLKALGFKNYRVTWHYISYGLFLSILGACAGIVVGYYLLGPFMLNMEMDYFEVPNYSTYIDIGVLKTSLFVIFLVCLFTYFSTRKTLKESASEILRVERPKVKLKSLKLTQSKLFSKLSFKAKWNIRDILRNKMRTLTGILGIAGCALLIVCALGMLDTINNYLDTSMNTVNHYQYRLNLNDNITDSELDYIYNNISKYSSKSYGIELDIDNELIDNNLFVDDSNSFIQFLDEDSNIMKLSSDGAYITRKLAKTYGYKIGDKIRFHIYGDDTYYEVKIVGFNKDAQNQNMTMTKEYFESLGLEYKPDSIYTNDKVDSTIDGVSTIQSIDSIKKGLSDMTETMKSMIFIIILLASILGIIIIYNMGVLSFSEKDYQFATLKVLGFDDKKIEKIFTEQNMWISIVGLVIGIPGGYYFTDYLFKYAISDHYDFGAYITLRTYLIGIVSVLLITIVVNKLLAKKVKKIDMVKSLKGNE